MMNETVTVDTASIQSAVKGNLPKGFYAVSEDPEVTFTVTRDFFQTVEESDLLP